LGGIRSASQMISYDVYFGLTLVPLFFYAESVNFIDLMLFQKNIYFIFALLPLGIIFFITMLAETNRTPFDLPEAEAEIVAGYNVEYAGLVFSFFFLAEYNNIFLSSSYIVIFFFGGVSQYLNLEIFFFFKVIIVTIFFIFVRGILPRYRYDQLMSIG
jgi:NADH-quinone oxidoreductase subunit H